MTDEPIKFDLGGCVKKNGTLCVPLPEVIKLLERFPYHPGRDFAEVLKKANVSDKVKEMDNEGNKTI